MFDNLKARIGAWALKRTIKNYTKSDKINVIADDYLKESMLKHSAQCL